MATIGDPMTIEIITHLPVTQDENENAGLEAPLQQTAENQQKSQPSDDTESSFLMETMQAVPVSNQNKDVNLNKEEAKEEKDENQKEETKANKKKGKHKKERNDNEKKDDEGKKWEFPVEDDTEEYFDQNQWNDLNEKFSFDRNYTFITNMPSLETKHHNKKKKK